MAEAEAPAQTDGTDAGTPKGKKKLLVLALVAVLAGLGGFFAMKMLSPATAEAATPASEPPPEEGAVLEVAEMTATLAGDTTHLARVGFAVVTAADADPTLVEPKFALLKDAAVDEMAASSAAALITPEGVDDLRARLTARALDIYPDGEVLRVVLTQLVVQ
jgi:flagellar protein FliL